MLKQKGILKEICIKLNLDTIAMNESLLLIDSFEKSKTHSFQDEVIISACIYLSSKINEDFKRIRGNLILNSQI